DCYWFEKSEPFTEFDRTLWPNGPDSVFERAKSMGMKLGLWYPVNGQRMTCKSWDDSRAEEMQLPGFSLVDGPFADDFEAALLHAAEVWGVRHFKFDFAAFGASAANSERSVRETMRQSIARFKQMLRKLRAAFPDVHVITHCGFARTEQSTVAGSPLALAVDPAWLEVADGMFPGDPHPIDIPQTSLVRNIDVYSDRQVWALHRHGYPLHRIEDSACIIGDTNTCCYRGREGFRRTWLATLARCSRRGFFYGNPEVLTDDDVVFMKDAQDLFFDAFGRNLNSSFVGDGEPGQAPWHGYLTGGGDCGLLYLVNPHQRPVESRLLLTDLNDAHVLFHDGEQPPVVQVQPDLLCVQLGPEQMTLIGTGAYAATTYELGNANDPPLPGSMSLLPCSFREVAPGSYEATISLDRGRRVFASAQTLEREAYGVAEGLPYRFGRQFSSGEAGSDVPASIAHDQLQINLQKHGEAIEETRRIPDVPIWSGISWVAKTFDAPAGDLVLRVTQSLPEKKRILVRVYTYS
ncbi:MAG: hypothetical protein ACLFP4_07070, partial [Spirochaetales bacterium]